MVKSSIKILACVLLIAVLSFFEWNAVSGGFETFHAELLTLSYKVDENTANVEDAKAVQLSWEECKKTLHVWIPHNSVTLVDEYMAETVGLIEQKEYALAGAKIDVILHLTHCLPNTYQPNVENIF